MSRARTLGLVISLGTLCCLTFGAPRQAAAQGFIIPEIGARKNAMGTAIGRPDDLSAIYHNPAALTRLRGTHVGMSFGAAYLRTNIRLAPWGCDTSGCKSNQFIDRPVDAGGYYPEQSPGIFAPIPFLGASTNLWSEKLVGAVGIYVPNAAGATFGKDAPSRYHIIDAYLVSAYFTLAVAYQPLDWLSVGVGASVAYIRVKRQSLLYPVIEGLGAAGEILLGNDTGIEIIGEDIKPAFSLGVQMWPHRTVSIGLMFLTPPLPDVEITGDMKLQPGKTTDQLLTKPNVVNNTHRTELGAPWVLAIGANWDVTPWLEIGAEFRYYINSHIKEQVTTIESGGLKALLPGGQLVTPKNLKNAFHTGAGVLVRPPVPLDLEVMAGYHYEISNSPDNTVEVSAPSFDLLSVHIGARWRFGDRRYALTLAYSHYWYFERTTTESLTSPPTNFQGSAATDQATLVFEVAFDSALGITVRQTPARAGVPKAPAGAPLPRVPSRPSQPSSSAPTSVPSTPASTPAKT
jgi:long-subunit fatty acid transport protein